MGVDGPRYYIGVDPGVRGGAVLVRDDSYLVDVIPFDPQGTRAVADDVWSWTVLYNISGALIEHVGVVQKQANNAQLVASMGWWWGVLDSLKVKVHFARPAVWKPRAGIPPAPNGAKTTAIKRLAIERAESVFPDVIFRGKRGGILSADYKAEAALMALVLINHSNGVRPLPAGCHSCCKKV